MLGGSSCGERVEILPNSGRSTRVDSENVTSVTSGSSVELGTSIAMLIVVLLISGGVKVVSISVSFRTEIC